MSHFNRHSSNGVSYFFTVATYQRKAILCDPLVRHLLRQAFKDVSRKYPFQINAWVLLPDHLHCIWTLPAHDDQIIKRWSMLTRYVSVKYTQQHSALASTHERFVFWEPRVRGRRLHDDNDRRRHTKRIHIEPVKHGLCHTVYEWPYSSIHRHSKSTQYPIDLPLPLARSVALRQQ